MPPTKLLIVEDEAVIAMELEDRLTHLGYSVAGSVSSFDAAIQSAAATPLDLVLMDIHLQGQRDGIAAAGVLRERFDLPIVYLTAYADDVTLRRAQITEPFGYLLKPFRERELHATIEMALYRHRSERELRRSRAQYERVVKHIKMALVVEELDGRIAYANDAFLRLSGWSRDDLEARTLADLIAPEWCAEWQARRAMSTSAEDSSIEFECVAIRPDGATMWLEVTLASVYERGQPVGVQIILHDVTARRQADIALREQQALVERVTQTMPDVVYVVDLAGGREVFSNRRLATLLGYAADAIGAPGPGAWWPLIHPDDAARVRDGLAAVAGTHSSEVVEIEFRMREASGEWRWLYTRNAAFSRADDGSVRQMLCIVQDISERVRTEEQVRRHAQRAEALSHIATQLNAQLSFTGVLQAVCEETARTLHGPAVSLALADATDQTLSIVADDGLPTVYRERHTAAPLSAFAGISAEQPDEPLVIPDVQAVAGLEQRELYQALDIRTIAGIGLVRGGRLLGGLQLLTRGRTRDYSSDDLALLKGLAAQATQAIANAQLYEESQRRLSHLQALRMIDLSITSSLDLDLTLAIFLDQVLTQLHVDAAAVLLLRPQTQTLRYAAGRGFRTEALQYTHLRLGEGLAGSVALERRMIAVANLQDTSLFMRSAPMANEGFVAYYGVPLIAKGQVQGVLEVLHRSPLRPDSEWLRFLEVLGSQAAIAIESITLFEHLQRSNTELALAYDTTLEGWSRALDLRDKETEGHSQRVTEMTVRLSRVIGLDDNELVHVRRGALLHDIGKMGIPDRILLKPDKLTEDEWSIMRLHPVYAYQLLYPVKYLRPALDIPYCHHEKWDGSGYPRGLAGEEIPLPARLFAIVDVWDALRSDRPYRKAWPDARVLEHLRGLGGSHFDRRLLEVFLELIQTGRL